MLLKASPYSYREDPAVPKFDDSGFRTVMDAHCSLCAKGARWIAQKDKAEKFKIIPLQSALGNALMMHYGLDPDDPVSWLYLEEGKAYTSLDALIRVGERLGGTSRALAVLRVLPVKLQDYVYTIVARNRYRLGTSSSICAMPDAAVQKRIL